MLNVRTHMGNIPLHTLHWIDLAALSVIIDEVSQGNSPTHKTLFGKPPNPDTLLGRWLDSHSVPVIYGKNHSGANSAQASIGKLRAAGLLEPAGSYTPTAFGRKFMKSLGADWKRWPRRCKIVAGRPDLSTCEYVPNLA